MGRPAKTLNKHVTLPTRRGKYKLPIVVEGVMAYIHVRFYRDKRTGKKLVAIAGPGLREG